MEWKDIVYFCYSFFQFHEEFETFDVKNLSALVANVGSIETEKRSLAFIINSFYEWHAQQQGIKFERWGDKTPLNVYVLKRIQEVFPRAQFIHIVRDGFDVVASYLQAGIYESAEDAKERDERFHGSPEFTAIHDEVRAFLAKTDVKTMHSAEGPAESASA